MPAILAVVRNISMCTGVSMATMSGLIWVKQDSHDLRDESRHELGGNEKIPKTVKSCFGMRAPRLLQCSLSCNLSCVILSYKKNGIGKRAELAWLP